jgi:hypothetical protein
LNRAGHKTPTATAGDFEMKAAAKNDWIKSLDAETQQAIARVQAIGKDSLTHDVWTKSATDWLRIAVFAGFDLQVVMRICFRLTKNSRAQRINAATVDRAMGLYSQAFKQLETEGAI